MYVPWGKVNALQEVHGAVMSLYWHLRASTNSCQRHAPPATAFTLLLFSELYLLSFALWHAVARSSRLCPLALLRPGLLIGHQCRYIAHTFAKHAVAPLWGTSDHWNQYCSVGLSVPVPTNGHKPYLRPIFTFFNYDVIGDEAMLSISAASCSTLQYLSFDTTYIDVWVTYIFGARWGPFRGHPSPSASYILNAHPKPKRLASKYFFLFFFIFFSWETQGVLKLTRVQGTHIRCQNGWIPSFKKKLK